MMPLQEITSAYLYFDGSGNKYHINLISVSNDSGRIANMLTRCALVFRKQN